MIDTPFGKQFIFDAHTHFLSHTFMTKLASLANFTDARQVCTKLDWELPPEDPAELGGRWVKELDDHGVDRAVLFHTLPGDVASVAATTRAFPDRFVAFVMINPTEPSAVETLKTALDDKAFCGVTLFPAMHHFDLGSDAARKVYELADANRLAVFVHCGVLKVGFRRALGIRCDFDATKGNPLGLQRVAAEFSEARFIIPHLGSGMLRELLMLADSVPNVYTDTSGIDGWARYLPPGGTGSVSPEDCLKQVIDILGPERVLFGSDSSFFPRGWRRDVFERQLELFQKLRLTSEEVKMIVGSNLERLLRNARVNG